MTCRKTVLLFALIGLVNSYSKTLLAQDIDYKGLPEWTWHKEDSTEYYLYTPSKMEAGKKYPVALFMHGCCGETYHATLRNAVDPPVRMWHQFGDDKQNIPTYIIAPATSKGWTQHFVNLKKVMDDIIANHNADPQRIYVCGFSMGGEGTFKIIQQYPGYFAAAILMGMSFTGDSLLVKDIPLWTNQGETDWFSRFLKKQVAAIRMLNGYQSDTGNTWVTGVNPRYSNFRGVGHGVQWNAASTQDLTAWAFSKINDGNKYPVVFFKKPVYKQTAQEGTPIAVDIFAKDPDGIISKVEVYQNKKMIRLVTREPFTLNVDPVKGDNLLEAIAYDDKGKTSIATNIIRVNIQPRLEPAELPAARAGNYYTTSIKATGNGDLYFTAQDKKSWPVGLQLYPDGTFKGLPLKSGTYHLAIRVKDEDDELATGSYTIRVNQKKKEDVLVTNALTKDGTICKVSKMMHGETPCFNSKDSFLTTDPEEINFSGLDKYEGYTYIKTDINDANKSTEDFLSFNIDEDAVIYVAYEKLDGLKHSSLPAWLQGFQKEPGEIVAQYRYFDVFSKKYKKGKVVLPGADAKANSVGSNYFVMVKKAN